MLFLLMFLTKSADDADDDEEEDGEGGDEQGWMGWAWSYVPPLLPTGEGMDGEEYLDEDNRTKKKPEPAVLEIGFYVHKACVMFKVKMTSEHFLSKNIFLRKWKDGVEKTYKPAIITWIISFKLISQFVYILSLFYDF